jgi:hypothetical protein
MGVNAMKTQRAEIEDRHVVARRLFDALCAQLPDKYIALIQSSHVPEDRLPNLTGEKAATAR